MDISDIDEPKKTRTSYLLLTFTWSIDGIVKLVQKKKKGRGEKTATALIIYDI